MEYILIIIGAIFVNNVVLSQFLAICPFLGVSKDVKSSLGMGGAVLFVMLIATLVTYLIQIYVLNPYGLAYLQTICFILVIAGLVQMVEIILKKIAPALYQTLGIFLPLIAVNCAIMGGSLFMQQRIGLPADNSQAITCFADSVAFAIGSGLGWMIAIVLFAAIREKMEYCNIPKPLRGLGIAFITVGLMAMAFMCFSGIKM